MKLSIIIPAYNVGKYIAKCLYSCLNQDVRSEDYEIIVVNDGSPDNSQKIIDKYFKKIDSVAKKYPVKEFFRINFYFAIAIYDKIV